MDTIVSVPAGSIVWTGYGCPRCFRVLDDSGRDLSPAGRVDMGTAYRILAGWLQVDREDRTA